MDIKIAQQITITELVLENQKLKQERDDAREHLNNMQDQRDLAMKVIKRLERDEAREIAKEAISGLYNLGDYDLANRLTSKLEETK